MPTLANLKTFVQLYRIIILPHSFLPYSITLQNHTDQVGLVYQSNQSKDVKLQCWRSSSTSYFQQCCTSGQGVTQDTCRLSIKHSHLPLFTGPELVSTSPLLRRSIMTKIALNLVHHTCPCTGPIRFVLELFWQFFLPLHTTVTARAIRKS